MNRFALAVANTLIAAAVVITLAAQSVLGCGFKPTPRDVTSVLSIIEIGCILAHEEVEDSRLLAEACGIASEKAEDITKLVSGRKEGKMQRAKLGAASSASTSPSPSSSCPGAK